MKQFETLEFRYITRDDSNDNIYSDGYAWSRPYEYKLVLDKIKEIANKPNPAIHNSSWGYQGVHVIFKEELDKFSDNVLHTDVIPSELPKTDLYDITTNNPKYKEYFDIVINVSTLEEVGFNHSTILHNLLDQVKVGGYFIGTFDIPGLDVKSIEQTLSKSLTHAEPKLSGLNSKYPNQQCANLNCSFLVIKKLA